MTKARQFFDRVLQQWFRQPPSFLDAVYLSVFTVLITFNPYYADGRINLFEMGLYLPGIQGVMHGMIPYRDFFHLRGPFELYPPAFLMSVFGAHIKVLYSYFYFGNVVCLVTCVWIARELFKTRFMFYILIPVLIARTFPRVVFMIWGGMRYAWGLIAELCVIKFFKTERPKWMFFAGMASATAGFTSVEIGVYSVMGVVVAWLAAWFFRLQERTVLLRSLGFFVLGILCIAAPFFIYLAVNGALMPYIESTLTVVLNQNRTFNPHFVSVYPQNFSEALTAMTNFTHTNFKHMTPSYFYIAILAYVGYRLKRRLLNRTDLCLIFLGVYGFIMYNTGFRGIWAAQFEMALMPEKILYFFLIEALVLSLLFQTQLLERKAFLPAGFKDSAGWKRLSVIVFILALLGSSVGYSIGRYNHRFVAFKMLTGKKAKHYKPLANEPSAFLTTERAKGIEVPIDQADDLEYLMRFIETHTTPQDVVATYPEQGSYNFLADRPYLGRFPLATFSWYSEKWHEEYVRDIKSKKVKYLIVPKKTTPLWEGVYLSPERNRRKYFEVMAIIQSDYVRTDESPLSYIYEPKAN